MKKMFLSLAAASLCAGTATAGLNYNTMELDWVHAISNVDFIDSSDGVAVEFSYSPIKHLFLVGGGSWSTLNTSSRDFDAFGLHAGVGGYLPLVADSLHLVGEVGLHVVDVDAPGSSSDTALFISPYLRWQPVQTFELRTGVGYSAIDGSDNFVGFVDAFVQVFEGVDLHAGGAFGDDATGVSVGVRLRF